MSQERSKKTRWFVGGLAIFLVLSLGFGVSWYGFRNQPVSYQNITGKLPTGSVDVNLTLKKSYVCGVDEEEKLTKSFPSLDQVSKEYHDWQLVDHQGTSFIFKKQIQDLAPICKEKGYFGLTGKGVLALFEGPPNENKIIQTFYQIDTKKIEARIPHELEYLQKGIRIKDLAEYNSILSTYDEFADWSNTGQPHPNDQGE